MRNVLLAAVVVFSPLSAHSQNVPTIFHPKWAGKQFRRSYPARSIVCGGRWPTTTKPSGLIPCLRWHSAIVVIIGSAKADKRLRVGR